MAKKFKTLEHKGPLFPAPYEYKGKFYVNGIKLDEFAEDMLWHWSVLAEDYRNDKVFQKNFAATFLKNVPEGCPKTFPEGYEKTIKAMQDENELIKEAKKLANTKEAREAKKLANEKIKAEYGVAMLDGKPQPVQYMLEPEGIYMGRGKCPVRGMWKWAVIPEDVTINYIGDESKIPQPPKGRRWKAVVQDTNNMATVLFDVRIGEGYAKKTKGFGFGATSTVKQNSDVEKFEKAQQLAKDWNKIEKWINDGIAAEKQEALVAWLILRSGIRVGNEKSEKWENNVVGASTLQVKNIKVSSNDEMALEFIGKDSVKYSNTFKVPADVAAFLKKITAAKSPTDKVFDKASAATVNAFLAECLPYCTAKLFRTAYGTKLLAEELQKAPLEKGLPEWKVRSLYDNACLVVSTKLNHQKNVAKNYAAQIDKTDETIKKAKESEKAKKEKAKAQMAKLKKQALACKKRYHGQELKELLDAIKAKGAKIQEQLEKAEQRVEKLEANKDLKKATKNIALNTAKMNYSSPLIAASLCSDLGVSPDIIYNKTAQKKFSWAFEDGVVSKNFWKNYPKEKSNVKC